MFPKQDTKRSRDYPDSKANLFIDDEVGEDAFGNQLAYETVDNIFIRENGAFDDEESSCQAPTLNRSEYSVDKRLKYWQDVLQQRHLLQQKLAQASNKQPKDMLSNRLSTIDPLEKQTVFKILDYAQRLEPTTLAQKKVGYLAGTHCTDAIYETLPKTERTGKHAVEIIGLPRYTAKELLGAAYEPEQSASKWPELEKRLEDEFENIERVVQFCPDISPLEVVVKKAGISEKLDTQSIYSVSSMPWEPTIAFLSTNTTQLAHSNIALSTKKCLKNADVPEQVDLALNINGTVFKKNSHDYCPTVDRLFICEPYERIGRTALSIQNIGQRSIQFKWSRRNFFSHNSTLFKAHGEEFIFDTEQFQLKPGEVHRNCVLFRPAKVCVIKEKWLLTTHPRLFMQRPWALILKLHGRCVPSKMYTHLLKGTTRLSSIKARGSKKELAAPADLYFPWQCPYQRELDVLEIFNQVNVGYYCTSYSDMEQLQQFARRLLAPKGQPWNFSVKSLIRFICSQPSVAQRLEYYQEFQSILSGLRSERMDQVQRLESAQKLAQRQLTRYIYVRGIISNYIDVWESQIWKLATNLMKLTRTRSVLSLSDVNNRVKRHLNSSKYFKDSIYMHTYSLLCEASEDIVSVIESTELV